MRFRCIGSRPASTGGERRAWSAGRHSRLPFRPGRRPHQNGEGARRRLEADVRRLPAGLVPANRPAVRAVRPGRGLRQVRRRQAPAGRNALVSRLPRHRTTRRQRGRPAAGADRAWPQQPQEPDRPASGSATDGVEAYEGSVRYVRAVRDAGLRRAVVSSSANAHDVLVAAGIEDLFEVRIDGVVAEREHLRGKPAPDTFLAGARALGLEPRPGGGLRGRAGRCGSRPGGRVRLRRGGGPGRARRTSCANTARTSSSPTSPSCWTAHDQACGVHRRAVVPAGDRAGPRRAGPDGVGVRAVERPPRLAGQPGRGRAARPAGNLPQRGLRGPAAAVRRGVLRPARSPGRRSSTSPTAS